MQPLLTAITSSTRQLLLLLRCISFAKKAHVRISAQGIRISTEEGSAMEAFVLLEKKLFTTYTYNPPTDSSEQDDTAIDPEGFEISMTSLMEILNIFTLSDPTTTSKRPGAADGFDAFAAHRLGRHAGINAFSPQTLGISGTFTLVYEGEGSPLSILMSEKDVTTTCDLTTYSTDGAEEIPFAREHLALKTIMRSSVLLDAISELSALGPAELTLRATPPSTRSGESSRPQLILSATGALGSAAVSFSTNTTSETPVLETYHCPEPTSASFKFSLVKAAQRAMQAATKVSVRLDHEGVLSLQFLVGMGDAGPVGATGEPETVAFVDFRIVPLLEGEAGGDVDGEGSAEDDSD